MTNKSLDTVMNSPSGQAALESILVMSEFDGFELGELLGVGAYSLVRAAIEKTTGKSFAIKFAIENGAAARAISETGYFYSMPLGQITGSYGEVKLEPADFLLNQYRDWSVINCHGFPKILKICRQNGFAIAIMERIEGLTLRRLILDGKANLDHLIALVSSMHAIETANAALKHGDLKPENIVITTKGASAYVLDPGYFGNLTTIQKPPVKVKMTTPLYYPFLEPDDMFATGIMLLEVFTGKNPLASEGDAYSFAEKTTIEDTFHNRIESARLSNNHYPSKLYRLPQFLKEHQTKLGRRLSSIALKCMGAAIKSDNSLRSELQYENFAQLQRVFSPFHTQ